MKHHIQIYSRGEYENLGQQELKNKAIIRIHNTVDKKWYASQDSSTLIQLFFDDLSPDSLSESEKFLAYHPLWKKIYQYNPWFNHDVSCPIDLNQAKAVVEFIKKNKDNDFIIHCEYGKSRSVAVALFIKNHFDAIIVNKTEKECQAANAWVLTILNHVYEIKR